MKAVVNAIVLVMLATDGCAESIHPLYEGWRQEGDVRRLQCSTLLACACMSTYTHTCSHMLAHSCAHAD